jgi:hypothetical protein
MTDGFARSSCPHRRVTCHKDESAIIWIAADLTRRQSVAS